MPAEYPAVRYAELYHKLFLGIMRYQRYIH
jgi:hypothetical protein